MNWGGVRDGDGDGDGVVDDVVAGVDIVVAVVVVEDVGRSDHLPKKNEMGGSKSKQDKGSVVPPELSLVSLPS